MATRPGRHLLRISSALIALGWVACATPPPAPPSPAPGAALEAQLRAERRAAEAKTVALERDVARLRTDLRQAEEALIAAESGLSGSATRADAVSSLAEARIQYERATRRAPWRGKGLAEAQRKLEEADRQIGNTHFGAAIFFASRAKRICESLVREAQQAEATGDILWVRARRANLRSGPSQSHKVVEVLDRQTPVVPEGNSGSWTMIRTPAGSIGWMHRNLLVNKRPS